MSRNRKLLSTAAVLAALGGSAIPAAAGASSNSDLHRFVTVNAHGVHSLKVGMQPPSIDAAEYGGMKVYVQRGRDVPGTASSPPKRKPAFACTGRPCFRRTEVILNGLAQLKPYTVAVFDYDKVHHYVRDTEVSGRPAYPYAPGFYISGQGRVPRAAGAPGNPFSSFVRNSSGVEDVLSARSGPSDTGGFVEYLHRDPRSGHWTHQRVPSTDKYQQAFAARSYLSTDGKRVLSLIDQCDGMQVEDAKVTASTLPAPAVAPHDFSDADECGDDINFATLNVNSASGLPHHKFALLVSHTDEPYTDTIYTYEPGGAFKQGPDLPVAPHADISAGSITRDRSTGELVVSGRGTDGGVWIWTKQPGGAWSNPVEVAPPVDRTYTPESITAADGQITVGMTGYRIGGNSPGTYGGVGLYIVRRSKAGNWSAPQLIPKTGGNDGTLIVRANPATGSVHVVYERATNSPVVGSGIIHDVFANGWWAHRRFLTHWYDDWPDQLIITKAGHPIVAYSRI